MFSMTRARYYTFTDNNGEIKLMTLEEARKCDDIHIKDRIKQIISNFSTKRMKKDGFEPGWQENIQAYAGGRREYNRLLKEKGLVEIGYDYVPQESNPNIHPCANEEFVKSAIEAGVDLSENEAEAIKSGEYFKDE